MSLNYKISSCVDFTTTHRAEKGLLSIAFFSVFLLLSGCSGESNNPSTTTSQSSAPLGNSLIFKGDRFFRDELENRHVIVKREGFKGQEAYKLIDFTSRKSYVGSEIDDVKSFMRNAYWAASEFDPIGVGYDFVPEIAAETDVFKRKDLVDGRLQDLKRLHANAAEYKNIGIFMDGVASGAAVHINSYDLSTNTFAVSLEERIKKFAFEKSRERNQYWTFVLFGKAPENYESVIRYKPKDEQEARLIESFVSAQSSLGGHRVPFPVIFYGKAVSSQPFNANFGGTVGIRVDYIAILKPGTKEILFGLGSDALGANIKLDGPEGYQVGIVIDRKQ